MLFRSTTFPSSLELYEYYLGLTKDMELSLEESNKKYIDDGNVVVECVSSELYIDEYGLYAFDYIIESGDTFEKICRKFKLPEDKQKIYGDELLVGDVVTLFTADDTLAEYQQAIFEYINSGRNKNK